MHQSCPQTGRPRPDSLEPVSLTSCSSCTSVQPVPMCGNSAANFCSSCRYGGSRLHTHKFPSNMPTNLHKLLHAHAGATSFLPTVDVLCGTGTRQQLFLLQTAGLSLCLMPVDLHSGSTDRLHAPAGALYASERSLAAINPGDRGFVIPGQVRCQITHALTCRLLQQAAGCT